MMKSLPVTYPKVYTFPRHAYCLAILGDEAQTLPWLYSNYIQLRCRNEAFKDHNFRSDWFDFDSYLLMVDDNPLLQSQVIFREFLDKYVHDPLAFVIDTINEGYYLFITLNDYYVPGTISYQTASFSHASLIYGYDEEARTLDIALYNRHRNFVFSKIGFDDFVRAYEETEVIYDYMRYNYLIRPRAAFKYDYDLNMSLQSFRDYMQSGKTCDTQYDQYRLKGAAIGKDSYGLGVYERLQRYVAILEDREPHYDLRPFHLLWEHKKCLSGHIAYLQARGFLPADQAFGAQTAELERDALTMRNLLIKAAMSYQMDRLDRKSLGSLQRKLLELRDKEAALLEPLIGQLSGAAV